MVSSLSTRPARAGRLVSTLASCGAVALALAAAPAHAGNVPHAAGSCVAGASSNSTFVDKTGRTVPTGPNAATKVATLSASGPVTFQWGALTWLEPALHCGQVGQTFDYWPATGGTQAANHPTIVYFHPNGATSHVKAGSPLYENVVLPATTAGYNVVSVEFRHPVIDQYLAAVEGGKVPAQDTGLVIQFLRTHAAALRISQDNLFAFGYSRGSLALWQQLQPDLGGGSTGRPSSKVSAFVGYQAQTTYRCDEYGALFLDPADPGTAPTIATCDTDNPYEAQFGSAVDAVTANSLPVKLQYQLGFELQPGSETDILPITATDLFANFEAEHYPDYGIALYDAYLRAGNARMAYPEQDVPETQQFVGWQAFITPLLQPDAP